MISVACHIDITTDNYHESKCIVCYVMWISEVGREVEYIYLINKTIKSTLKILEYIHRLGSRYRITRPTIIITR